MRVNEVEFVSLIKLSAADLGRKWLFKACVFKWLTFNFQSGEVKRVFYKKPSRQVP